MACKTKHFKYLRWLMNISHNEYQSCIDVDQDFGLLILPSIHSSRPKILKSAYMTCYNFFFDASGLYSGH